MVLPLEAGGEREEVQIPLHLCYQRIDAPPEPAVRDQRTEARQSQCLHVPGIASQRESQLQRAHGGS